MHPEWLATDGHKSMLASLWFYMTPQSPKPSMHEVLTGFFDPSDSDIVNNIDVYFGTVTNIINGSEECGPDAPHPEKALTRGAYYNDWLGYFGLPKETDE